MPGLDWRQLAKHRPAFGQKPDALIATSNRSCRLAAVDGDAPAAFERAATLVRTGSIAILHTRSVATPDALDLGFLGPQERQRFDTYVSQQSARLFLSGRRLVKRFHATWLSCSPYEIAMTSQEHKKPQVILPEGLQSSDLPCFNISHSCDHAVVAIAEKHAVGIDIELSTAIDADCPHSLGQVFTPEEIAHIGEPDIYAARLRRFLALWRAKEAVMKATGLGFALQPKSFSALARDGTIRQAVRAGGRKWRLDTVEIAPGLDAACAWEQS